jgi:hypothetical protein
VSSHPGSAPAPASPQDQPASSDRFEWHPTYRGKTVAEVRDEVKIEVGRDQRSYALAMGGADRDENAVLATVVELEKKWGPFDLDWSTAEPAALADRIVAFELDRERQRELFPFGRYRERQSTAAGPTARSGRPSPSRGGGLSEMQPRLLWLLAIAGVVLLLLLLLL